ncbi:hypothetical protein D3C71_2199320 [compost metagenome]
MGLLPVHWANVCCSDRALTPTCAHTSARVMGSSNWLCMNSCARLTTRGSTRGVLPGRAVPAASAVE